MKYVAEDVREAWQGKKREWGVFSIIGINLLNKSRKSAPNMTEL